jgi:hypothetical protein
VIVDARLRAERPDLGAHDRAVLRELAAEVAALARQSIEREKQQLWRQHNKLARTRPLIFCSPESAWHEIIPADTMRCTAQTAREWELLLRQQIFYGRRMGDDYTLLPFFEIAHVHEDPDWGLAEQRVGNVDRINVHQVAYTWIAPVKEAADLELLHPPVVRVDFATTQHLVDLARDVFGDLLPVRLKTLWWWTLGMTWTAVNLRGLEQIMYDLVDAPALLHRLMAILRDGTLELLAALEAAELLSLNSDATYIGSGALGWSDELPQPDHAGRVRLKDMWGFAESQETVGVSPRMFEEFVLPYQLPVLDRFGLNCYGCCEPLEKRWPLVQRLPRLRRVSVSPWSDRAMMARYLEDRFIFSLKPNPAALATATLDRERLRMDMRRDLEAARDCCLEIVMKDNLTVGNDPERLVWWVRMVREEIDAVWR